MCVKRPERRSGEREEARRKGRRRDEKWSASLRFPHRTRPFPFPPIEDHSDSRLSSERQLERSRNSLLNDILLSDSSSGELGPASLDESLDDLVVPSSSKDADSETSTLGDVGFGEGGIGGDHGVTKRRGRFGFGLEGRVRVGWEGRRREGNVGQLRFERR